jgi:hypothetical protein
MKQVIAVMTICFLGFSAIGQKTAQDLSTRDLTKTITNAKAACGSCMFGMAGKSCELAVRIKNKSYYVDSVHIDAFGNSHASDGFCNSVRKAELQGEVINNRFQLTYMKLESSGKKND